MPTNRLGTHDLVGLAVLEHPILVNARFVGKGVGADNGLVRLHRETGDARYQARCTEDVFGNNTGIHLEYVLAGTQRHDDLFQRGVTSPRSEEHTSELQSRPHLVCRLLLEKKKTE